MQSFLLYLFIFIIPFSASKLLDKFFVQDAGNQVQSAFDFFGLATDKVPPRSLLTDFLSQPHLCSLSNNNVEDSSDSWPSNPVDPLMKSLDLIKEQFNLKDANSPKKSPGPCSYKVDIFLVIDRNPILYFRPNQKRNPKCSHRNRK